MVDPVDHLTVRQGLVDLQAPGQAGLPAVELLVEPVAPAAAGLGERDARREGVGPGGQRHPATAGADPGADRAERDGAPDAEAALPDLEGVPGIPAVPEVQLVVGDHVVEAAADQAERDGPDGDVTHRVLGTAPGDPAPAAEPDGHDDTDDDAEGVRAQRERPQVEDAPRRARNVSDIHGRVDATVSGGPIRHPGGSQIALGPARPRPGQPAAPGEGLFDSDAVPVGAGVWPCEPGVPRVLPWLAASTHFTRFSGVISSAPFFG